MPGPRGDREGGVDPERHSGGDDEHHTSGRDAEQATGNRPASVAEGYGGRPQAVT